MTKNWLVHPQTRMLEITESFATEYCRQNGFHDRGPQWKKWKEMMLDEAIYESILPGDSKYAKNPTVKRNSRNLRSKWVLSSK